MGVTNRITIEYPGDVKLEIYLDGPHAAAGVLLDALLGKFQNTMTPAKITVEPNVRFPSRKSEQPMLTVATGVGDNECVKDVILRHISNIQGDAERWMEKIRRDDDDLSMTVGEARAAGRWQP